ncbi:MAG: glycosyltransferase family 2 protein, partial [Methylococcales bacterium]
MNQKTVAILMSTYNGQEFLAEQLRSIAQQTHANWRVVLSDDGSTDDTLLIAQQFQEKWGSGRLETKTGPKQGFCLNFLSMACDDSIRADFYAFSDQDDVWMDDKLERALTYFESVQDEYIPRVYCGRTQSVDEQLNHLGYSPLFCLPRSFRNALVQSIAGGNTMVFNQAAKELIEKAGLLEVVSHDWWLYQLIKGAGGTVYYDPKPSILYRQHPNALVGANRSIGARYDRFVFAWNGGFKRWNDINYAALCSVKHLLTKDNREILELFGTLRTAKFKDRFRLLAVCGIYRQTWQGTLSLWLATFLN